MNHYIWSFPILSPVPHVHVVFVCFCVNLLYQYVPIFVPSRVQETSWLRRTNAPPTKSARQIGSRPSLESSRPDSVPWCCSMSQPRVQPPLKFYQWKKNQSKKHWKSWQPILFRLFWWNIQEENINKTTNKTTNPATPRVGLPVISSSMKRTYDWPEPGMETRRFTPIRDGGILFSSRWCHKLTESIAGLSCTCMYATMGWICRELPFLAGKQVKHPQKSLLAKSWTSQDWYTELWCQSNP